MILKRLIETQYLERIQERFEFGFGLHVSADFRTVSFGDAQMQVLAGAVGIAAFVRSEYAECFTRADFRPVIDERLNREVSVDHGDRLILQRAVLRHQSAVPFRKSAEVYFPRADGVDGNVLIHLAPAYLKICRGMISREALRRIDGIGRGIRRYVQAEMQRCVASVGIGQWEATVSPKGAAGQKDAAGNEDKMHGLHRAGSVYMTEGRHRTDGRLKPENRLHQRKTGAQYAGPSVGKDVNKEVLGAKGAVPWHQSWVISLEDEELCVVRSL